MMAVTSAELSYLRLEGTPRERGRAHGEELRAIIQATMWRWKDAIQAQTGSAATEYLDLFLDATDFLPSIERWTPDLLEEVRGLAEGCDVDFRAMYAYQLMDEEWIFRGAHRRAGDGHDLAHCSVLGAFGQEGQPSILAQNMDLPDYYDGSQTLLHVRQDDGLEALIFTPAGMIATTGLNNRGVGICCNTLDQLAPSTRGLPVAFVTRHALSHASAADAVRFISEVPHAAGQNYTVGGPKEIVSLECSAHKVARFTPRPRRVYHTNHPLVNDDLAARADAPAGGAGRQVAGAPAAALSNSERRFACLEEALADGAQAVTVEAAQAILSRAPVSVRRNNGKGSMTLGSLVMELSQPPVLHLSPGPPSDTAYRTWAFA